MQHLVGFVFELYQQNLRADRNGNLVKLFANTTFCKIDASIILPISNI